MPDCDPAKYARIIARKGKTKGNSIPRFRLTSTSGQRRVAREGKSKNDRVAGNRSCVERSPCLPWPAPHLVGDQDCRKVKGLGKEASIGWLGPTVE